jgi:energy-coupling factor transporter ATP-binding protein EcfA2
MRIKTLRVQSYKVIQDTQPFTLGDVTCLVGKNESGKSSILEALYRLNPAERDKASFSLFDYPRMAIAGYKERHETQPDNVVTAVFDLEDSDVAAVVESVGVDPFVSREIEVTKGYDNKRRVVMNVDERAIVEHFVKAMNFNAFESQQVRGPQTIRDLVIKLAGLERRSDKQAQMLERLHAVFPAASATQTIFQHVLNRLPRLVLFTEYYRLPGRVSITDLRERERAGTLTGDDRVFLALLDLAESNLDQLESIGHVEQVIMELEAIGGRLTDQIIEYWSTNKDLTVEFRIDLGKPGDAPPFNTGQVFSTRIRDQRHRMTVPFDERSKGFIWFFSFLVWFSQMRKTYGENLVILMDEPGLTLHGKAQSDLMRYFKDKLAPHYQVIYTTHSPFMIDPANLEAVRTVEDREEKGRPVGTKVGDKTMATDKDTLLPLQAALGYDIASWFFGESTKVVAVPELSHVLYLKWFSAELRRRGLQGLDSRWTISPVGGLTKVASLVTLLYGKRDNVALVTDYGGDEGSNLARLRHRELLSEAHVLTPGQYLNQTEADMEDMIGRETFADLVNRAYGLKEWSALPPSKMNGAPPRVVEETTAHFKKLDYPPFDRMIPASYLINHGEELRAQLPGLDSAVLRFEDLMRDLNRLLGEAAA